MRTVLSISIDPQMKEEIDRWSRISGTSRSEIVKRALRNYLYLQSLRGLRGHLKPYAERAGFYTDEDIFAAIS